MHRALGLTITEAAGDLGGTRTTLSELVNENRGVSPELAEAAGTGVTLLQTLSLTLVSNSFGMAPGVGLYLNRSYEVGLSRKLHTDFFLAAYQPFDPQFNLFAVKH